MPQPRFAILCTLSAAAFVAALSSLPSQLSAQESTGPEFFVIDGLAPGDDLNIRATASATGMIVGRLPNGSKLKNLGCSDVSNVRWCKVSDTQLSQLVGWAAGRYLIEFGAAVPALDDAASANLETELDEFDATGEIPCARYFGQPMTVCKAGVVRGEGGEAEVTVMWPDGGERLLRFRGGKPDSSDAPDDIRATRESDLHMIRIGKGERFEIPDVLALGG